jgi:hypothetical protein
LLVEVEEDSNTVEELALEVTGLRLELPVVELVLNLLYL